MSVGVYETDEIEIEHRSINPSIDFDRSIHPSIHPSIHLIGRSVGRHTPANSLLVHAYELLSFLVSLAAQLGWVGFSSSMHFFSRSQLVVNINIPINTPINTLNMRPLGRLIGSLYTYIV